MTAHTRVLIVDAVGPDSADHRHLLGVAGHETVHRVHVDEALEHLERAGADVVLLALAHAGLTGVTRLAGAPGSAPLVVMAGDASDGDVREALRLGAFDVVRAADAIETLLFAVERAAHAGALLREVAMLRARVGDRATHALVGSSSAMDGVRELVGRAAASRMTVLVSGEAGTGKDLVSRVIHDLSDRAGGPCVTVRCAGADPRTLEAELFGEADGDRGPARAGLFEQARGGTLVLDGYRELLPALRARVARTLADRAVRRVDGGADDVVPVDVRLILTALEEPGHRMHPAGEDDLPGRAGVLPIALPPLRERRRDIPALVQHFRARLVREAGYDVPAISAGRMQELVGRAWPGNVRELEHFVERAAYETGAHAGAAGAVFDEGLTLEALERRYILHVLDQVEGHQSRASERLGIDRRTLYRKLKQYRDEGLVIRNAI